MKKKNIILIIIWYYIWIAVCDIETPMKWFMISLKNASDELLMAQSPHVIVDGEDAKDKALEWVIICFYQNHCIPMLRSPPQLGQISQLWKHILFIKYSYLFKIICYPSPF